MNKYNPILKAFTPLKPLVLLKLVDAEGTLELTMTEIDGTQITAIFEDYYCYRKIQEGDALVSLALISKDAVQGMTFYEVTESDFLSWFMDESSFIHINRKLRHFCILTVDDIVEIISPTLPTLIRG